MPNLQEVHARMRMKKREQSEIRKMFKDALVHDAKYQEVVDQIKKLREQKKSIENAAWASSRADADKIDLLNLDIKSDKEMLASIALNMYVAGQTVEIVDENQARWIPQFSVNFTKDPDQAEDMTKPVKVEQVI